MLGKKFPPLFSFFFLNDPATTEISPLPLHDPLPTPQPAPLGRGKSGRQGGLMRRARARRQEAARSGDEPLRDRDDLLGRLSLAQNHLLVPLGEGSEVIDAGERQALDEAGQVVELHAACSTALPAR